VAFFQALVLGCTGQGRRHGRPDDSCLRLVRALAVETHENWLEQHRYLNMDDLREHKKQALRCAA
jgi:hypothetical protein